MASKERHTIVVDHVHSKRESPEEQPSETKGRHVGAAIYCLTRCRRKSLVTVVVIPRFNRLAGDDYSRDWLRRVLVMLPRK